MTEVRVKTSDDYVNFVRSFGRTSYHPVGTCSMGTTDDSVVSPGLKVTGWRDCASSTPRSCPGW